MAERRSLPHRLALLLVPTLGLAACATQSGITQSAPSAAPGQVTPASTAAPAAAADRESDGMEGQLAALTRAEADLNQALGRGKDKETAGRSPVGTGASPKSPQTGPSPQPGANPRPSMKSAEEAASSGDPCATACTALASMERATMHLCGLAGESDQRCEDARARVRSATGRVQASCPMCATR